MKCSKKCVLAAAVAAAIGLPLTAVAADLAPAVQISKVRTPEPASAVAPSSRIIVKYRDGSLESRSDAAKSRLVQSAAARAGVASSRRAAPLAATQVRRLGVGADLMRLSQPLSRGRLDQVLAQLRADPAVEYAVVDERDSLLRAPTDAAPTAVPDDPFFAQYQWNFRTDNPGGINGPATWDTGTGAGTVVAVLDTGVLYQHPDLSAGQLLEGYDFITDTFVSRRETADRVPGAADLGDWNDDGSECRVSSSSWHGTHVSGTVAQTTNNGIGAAGFAHDAKVLPVRVLGRCGGYLSDIADAVVWASGGEVQGVPANQNPAEVINMSLGGSGACGEVYQAAIDLAVANGTTVVVAAGNSNADAGNFRPASCNNVITVAASRYTGGKASYSNYGSVVDLAAPGGGGSDDPGNNGWDGYILQGGSNAQTTPESGNYNYMGYTGTSMAAPHVAAVAAVVQGALVAAERDPLTPADLEELLRTSARPFPVAVPSTTPIGSGIVDPVAALARALAEPCDPDVEDCAPPATPIANKVPLRNLGGAAGSETLYAIDVPAGVRGPLSITASGGSGDVSLYVSFDAEPEVGASDHRSTRPGNAESIRIASPQAGTYYIKLVGARAYSGVTLQARHN